MIRIETAKFIHEYFHRKNSSLTVRFILYNATRAQIKCNTFPAVLLSRGGGGLPYETDGDARRKL